MTTLKKWNIVDHLGDKAVREQYLADVFKDGDVEEIKRALFYVSQAEGIEKVAKKANLNRESLYKMFRANSKPRFESILKIMQALGLNFNIVIARSNN